MASPRTPESNRLNQIKSPPSSSKLSFLQNLSGPSKTSYGHICAFISSIRQWTDLQKNGTSLCRSIQMMRLHETFPEYPARLKIICDSLSDITETMKTLVESMRETSKQCAALARLITNSEPVFNTWSASKIAIETNRLTDMYANETEVKVVVKENIAHCRDENLCEVYTSAWEFNTCIDGLCLDFFLAEADVPID